MVISVPPVILPEVGEILSMTTSYLKSFAVKGVEIAFPNPAFTTFTSNVPGRPPGTPVLIKVSVT